MTTVHVSMSRDDGASTTAAEGSLYWEPTTRREDGTVVVLPQGFAMSLLAGEATATVAPTGLTWCWRVTERVAGGTVRYVSVPTSATTVEYVDLPDVDPTTLVEWSPADPEAAYLAALADLDVAAAVEDYLTANPPAATPDADATTKGILKLTNDLGGTADLPTVPGLADKANTADLGTAAAADTGDFVATADLTVTAGASISGTNTGDQDLSGYLTSATAATTYVAQADLTVTTGASVSGSNTGDEPDASETVKGIVELATTTEATTGTDTTRAVTPAGVAAAIAGVGGGVTDHGALSGLEDDDHTQYALADGTRGTFAAPLGADDNYVTDAQLVVIGNTSGTNTGDQDLSGYLTSATAATTYAPISGQFAVNTVAASGATETLPATHAAHKVTMDESCTFTFASPSAGHAFVLLLLGAFTPTFPASVDWAGGTAPTYAAGTLYHFATLDGGTTWLGSGQAYS